VRTHHVRPYFLQLTEEYLFLAFDQGHGQCSRVQLLNPADWFPAQHSSGSLICLWAWLQEQNKRWLEAVAAAAVSGCSLIRL
jgi:hypothetical protein